MLAYQFGMTAKIAATVALLVAACGSAQAQAGNVAPTPTDPATVVQSADIQAATLTSFVFNQQFNFTTVSGTGNVNGAGVTLDQRTVEGNVAGTFKHTLFKVNGGAGLTGYVAGFSPVAARINRNNDDSYTISYSLTSNGSPSSFVGRLTMNGMTAHYEQEGFSRNALNEEGGTVRNFGSTAITADFSTIPTRVTSGEIPGSPQAGRYQVQADRSMRLSWSPASGDVRGYDIYRLVLGVDHVPELIAQGPGTSFIDNSPQAVAHSLTATGIFYTVHAVGPTGIDSLQNISLLVAHIG